MTPVHARELYNSNKSQETIDTYSYYSTTAVITDIYLIYDKKKKINEKSRQDSFDWSIHDYSTVHTWINLS